MKKVIIILVIIIGVFCIVFIIKSSNHKDNLEKRLEVSLPKSTEILKYSNDAILKVGLCVAKISISDSDFDDFISQLNNYRLEDNIDNKPHEENIIRWWDLDKKDIEFWYSNLLSPNHFIFGLLKPKTAEQDIYITYSVNGSRTIYLVYVE